jgi:hypothetical protein
MLLMMAVVSNANWSANASTYSRHFDKPDIGRSVECVKVVKGCNGHGSVGSTGDTIIGNDDNNNTTDSSQVLGPINPKVCDTCFDKLTNDQKEALFSALDVSNGSDACTAIAELTGDDFMELLLDIGVDVFVAIDILDCLSEVDVNL